MKSRWDQEADPASAETELSVRQSKSFEKKTPTSTRIAQDPRVSYVFGGPAPSQLVTPSGIPYSPEKASSHAELNAQRAQLEKGSEKAAGVKAHSEEASKEQGELSQCSPSAYASQFVNQAGHDAMPGQHGARHVRGENSLSLPAAGPKQGSVSASVFGALVDYSASTDDNASVNKQQATEPSVSAPRVKIEEIQAWSAAQVQGQKQGAPEYTEYSPLYSTLYPPELYGSQALVAANHAGGDLRGFLEARRTEQAFVAQGQVARKGPPGGPPPPVWKYNQNKEYWMNWGAKRALDQAGVPWEMVREDDGVERVRPLMPIV